MLLVLWSRVYRDQVIIMKLKGSLLVKGALLFDLPGLAEAQCGNMCSGHGTCDVYSRCICSLGWQAADCSERICPYDISWADQAISTDTAHLSSECSSRGICNRRTGECDCQQGFTGIACQRTTCPNECSRQGLCVSMQEYSQLWQSADAYKYNYAVPWDAAKIYGCLCDDGYTGYDCSQRLCPSGDDPLTHHQANEVQLVQCVAASGYFALMYQGKSSAPIFVGDGPSAIVAAMQTISLLGPVQVDFSSGQRACTVSGTNVIRIEFVQNFGPLLPLTQYEGGLDNSGFVNIAARHGETIVDDQHMVYRPVKGSKENKACAGRGRCDETEGLCFCYDDYASSNGYGEAGLRGDCGYTLNNITSCPGQPSCSDHGFCRTDGTFRCDCADGWTGGDCSERTCPLGLSWFNYPSSDEVAHNTYTVCSDRGICDSITGECICADGFFGAACEYMGCGGSSWTSTCSGHGQCLTMSQLALATTFNRDATPVLYGSDPNQASTWDANSVYGCLCDPDFSGYDCSQRTCPYGDDPATYGKNNEVQLLKCTATAGSFKMTFREANTQSIGYNATSETFSDALNSLASIRGSIKAAFSSGAQVCQATGLNIVSIFFEGLPGNVPAIAVDQSGLSGSVDIATDGFAFGSQMSQQGTSESQQCNGRGLCDATTGLCKCLPGFSSTEDSVGDCGRRVAYRSSYVTSYT